MLLFNAFLGFGIRDIADAMALPFSSIIRMFLAVHAGSVSARCGNFFCHFPPVTDFAALSPLPSNGEGRG